MLSIQEQRLRQLREKEEHEVKNIFTFYFEFSNKKITGDKKAQEISLSLKKTFEATILTTLYPRSAISIFVEVLQADGGDYAVCVNAATLALIDAGIPIRDVCCAVSCGVAIKDNVAYSLLDLGRF
jgi:exosome complex component RRP41